MPPRRACFSLLMLVSGIAPIAAPLFGGLLINVTSWRGIFVVLSLLGAAGLVAVVMIIPETLPASLRHAGGVSETITIAKRVVRHRPLMGYALTAAFSSGALFFYISSSSFVFQDIYGLSSTQYSLIFAANAVGLMALGWLNATLVRRHDPATPAALGRLLRAWWVPSRCASCSGSGSGFPRFCPR